MVTSFEQTRLWSTLAINDIAGRYRGSILGPFWITLAQAAFVVGIGLVYGDLMHVSTEKYVPWMATGVTLWTLISMCINEGSSAFIEGAGLLRQTAIPMPLFVWRAIFRNVLNFGHQVIVIVAVAIWFGYLLKINLPVFILGFILLIANVSWIAFIAAIISARYRDVQQMISTILQLMFFISPVIFIPGEMKNGRVSWLQLNPVYHMLEVTRNPLLGLPVHSQSLLIMVLMALGGWLVAFILYGAVRRRIVHYL